MNYEELTSQAPIMLFMKGDKFDPRCGYSAKVVDILNELNAEYTTFDILEDDIIREGLKEYAEWPTYPQLYIKGELIGGCDIITEMHEAGELKDVLEAAMA
jgi:Grx4 family monothiol glutaredoxin